MPYEIVDAIEQGKTLYVPKARQERYKQWMHLLRHSRRIEPSDQGKCGVILLICRTKGESAWESFQDFDVEYANIGKVGKWFVDLFIVSVSDEQGRPVEGYAKRVSIDNLKYRVMLAPPHTFAGQI